MLGNLWQLAADTTHGPVEKTEACGLAEYGFERKVQNYNCPASVWGNPRALCQRKIIAAQKTKARPETFGTNLPFTIVMFCVHRMPLIGLSRPPPSLTVYYPQTLAFANWLSGSSVGFRSCPWPLRTSGLWGESIQFGNTTKVGSLAKVTNKAMLPPLLTAQHFWGQTVYPSHSWDCNPHF